MIVKGTRQLGSFKRGVNLYLPKKKIVTSPAPSGFPDTATTNVVNALINDSDETITAFLQNVGYTAVNNVFTVPMTKVNPPSQIYYSVEYKTTFYEDAYIQLIHSNATNRWFLI